LQGGDDVCHSGFDRKLVVSLILAGLAGVAPGAPPAERKEESRKASLPKGVRVRLGEASTAPGDAVEALVFSPDSQRLASAHRDHTLRLWEAASGKKVGQFRGADQPVAWLAFSPDGRSLLAAGESGADLWDAASGRRLAGLAVPEQRLLLATYAPDGLARAWTEDARHLLHGWDVVAGRETSAGKGHTDRVLSAALL
jgi:WD40 repeat protein